MKETDLLASWRHRKSQMFLIHYICIDDEVVYVDHG